MEAGTKTARRLAVGGAAALVLLAGCGIARVPRAFTPPLPTAEVPAGVPDLSERDSVTFLVFGDAGTGKPAQYAIGSQMARVCRERGGCDFGLALGDNIYERGVRPETAAEEIAEKFERPYEPLGDLDIWLVAGNHDWTRGRRSVDAQIAYTSRSSRWRMLGYHYAVPRLPGWLHVYGVDTAILDKVASGKSEGVGQIAAAEKALCGSSGWRILFGHHPVFTSAQHGGGSSSIASMESHLLPLIQRCDVQAYFAGHDHNQQHMTADRGDGRGFEQFVEGAAGKCRRDRAKPAHPAVRNLRYRNSYGFAVATVTADALTVRAYGSAPDCAEPSGDFEELYTCRWKRDEIGGFEDHCSAQP